MAESIKETNPDLIPKSELDRAKSEAQQSIDNLQKQIEDAKNQLLTPEYLQYLEAKRNPDKNKAPENDEVKALKTQLSEMRAAQAELAAHLELEQVVKAHSDFEEYRKDVQKILEDSKTDITIEQAYLIAKGKKPSVKPSEEKKPEHFSTEKPNGIYPPTNETEKKFKGSHDAGAAAVAEVLAKYNISGGNI